MSISIGITIDIIIVAIVAIFSIIGYKKGLLNSVLSIFSWSACILIAIFTAKYVAGWLNLIKDFSGLIGNKITKSLIKSNEFFAQSINLFEAGGKDALVNAIPNNVNSVMKHLIKIVFSSNKVDFSSSETIGSVVGASLGHIAMIVITGVLIFIVLMIIVALLRKIFGNIEKTTILGGLNKFLGLLLGLIKATLIVGIINLILVSASLVPLVNKTVTPIIKEDTYVERYIYKATDKLFEKYVIDGDLIENWVEDLWKKR